MRYFAHARGGFSGGMSFFAYREFDQKTFAFRNDGSYQEANAYPLRFLVSKVEDGLWQEVNRETAEDLVSSFRSSQHYTQVRVNLDGIDSDAERHYSLWVRVIRQHQNQKSMTQLAEETHEAEKEQPKLIDGPRKVSWNEEV